MPVFNQPTGAMDLFDAERNNAATLLGRTDLLTFFCPIAQVGTTAMQVGVGGTGSRTYVAGALQLASGATSGGTARLFAATDGSLWSKGIRTGADWYVSGYFSLATTPTTGTFLSIGSLEATGAGLLRIGVDFASNPTNYSLTGTAGAMIDSGLAFDTNTKHRHRGYRVGSVTSYQIDSRSPVTGTASMVSDNSPNVECRNGTNANQALEIVWYFCAVPPL